METQKAKKPKAILKEEEKQTIRNRTTTFETNTS